MSVTHLDEHEEKIRKAEQSVVRAAQRLVTGHMVRPTYKNCQCLECAFTRAVAKLNKLDPIRIL
jgi:hypothetical protein